MRIPEGSQSVLTWQDAHAQAACSVAVVERGPLKGREQEWNISRKELNELVSCTGWRPLSCVARATVLASPPRWCSSQASPAGRTHTACKGRETAAMVPTIYTEGAASSTPDLEQEVCALHTGGGGAPDRRGG